MQHPTPIPTSQAYPTQNPEFVEAPIPSESHQIMPDSITDELEINEDIKPLQIKQSPHSPEIEEIEQTDEFNLYSAYMDEAGAKSVSIFHDFQNVLYFLYCLSLRRFMFHKME